MENSPALPFNQCNFPSKKLSPWGPHPRLHSFCFCLQEGGKGDATQLPNKPPETTWASSFLWNFHFMDFTHLWWITLAWRTLQYFQYWSGQCELQLLTKSILLCHCVRQERQAKTLLSTVTWVTENGKKRWIHFEPPLGDTENGKKHTVSWITKDALITWLLTEQLVWKRWAWEN